MIILHTSYKPNKFSPHSNSHSNPLTNSKNSHTKYPQQSQYNSHYSPIKHPTSTLPILIH